MTAVRSQVFERLNGLALADAAERHQALMALAHAGARWRAFHPVNDLTGPEDAIAQLYAPLADAMPDLERRDLIFVAGAYGGKTFIAACGHYSGTFQRPWLGIPPTGRLLHVRYGEVYEIADGRVAEATLIWDVLDVIRQAGLWPLRHSTGREGLWLGPRTPDGVRLTDSDPTQSEQSIAQTLAMHQTLFAFDQRTPTREGLLTMEQRDYWHRNMMWFGPAGIGSNRGLAGFVDQHQLPFRQAFQRPRGTADEIAARRAKFDAEHFVRIGDGPYSVTAGWPSFVAHHYGGDFCGFAPTHRDITMRVMDFYRHDDGLIRENWVPIDMLDVFRQMDVDILGSLGAAQS
ncbi:MAG: ester cyclase [Pseudomonadota bacterium]